MTRKLVMMGPPLEGRGGMSAVAAAYRDGGLLDRHGVHYIATVADGSRWHKLAKALTAWLSLLGQLCWPPGVALVHIHVASGASFWRKALYVWTTRALGVPVVLHVHGGNFAEWAAGQPAVAQAFIRATGRTVAKVVVLSPSWVPRLAGWMPQARCMAIQNAVAPMASRPPVADPPLRFLFLGRLETDKGIDELLTAFARVHSRHPAAQLVLCGEGDRDRVQCRVTELGIVAAVEMPGWVVGEQKAAALRAADVFVLPSYIEGLPVSMLEAMQCGVPVVVTAVGSVPEVIDHGRNGLMVAPGNADALAAAMLRLCEEPGLAQRLAAAGRQTFDARYSTAAVEPLLLDAWRTGTVR